jgi:hypothetical protein
LLCSAIIIIIRSIYNIIIVRCISSKWLICYGLILNYPNILHEDAGHRETILLLVSSSWAATTASLASSSSSTAGGEGTGLGWRGGLGIYRMEIGRDQELGG